jgi:hypothetical protein
VFPPVDQYFGMTSQHDPTELSPILLITIDNKGNRWILSDILQPLERGAEASFGLCINRDVKRVVADRKTHWYHMRSCITIGCREMSDSQNRRSISDSIRGSTEHNPSLGRALCSNQHLAPARWDRSTT